MRSQSFYDGKYTVQVHDDGRMDALRHGQKWRNLTGDGMVLAMIDRCEELECTTQAQAEELRAKDATIAALRAALEEMEKFAHDNWSAREYYQTGVPRHVVVYRLWELIQNALAASAPRKETP